MDSWKKTCGVGHACLLIGSAAVSAVGSGSGAYAQVAPSKDSTELAEIVVTAQKREQLAQDVPIAITAIDQTTLQTNRVTTVTDLSGLAPNLVARESAGDVGTPAFSMRGITSYGTVPGSDKEISIYLDGVYIGAPRGSIFDLPDITSLEVLRGPQGTLFGRNATAGAINITTRNPTGKFGVQEEVTFGNYGQTRDRTSVDLPAWGPFSAYISYVYDYKRGDIRNLGAGQVWDRPGSEGIQVSPEYLGTHNSNSFFGVVEFEPNDSFKTTYKFDWSADYYTPDGVAAVGTYPPALGPVAGGFLSAVLAGSPAENLVTNGLRPSAVNNSWATEAYQRTLGHNLTSRLQLNDQSSVQNILAYRQAYVYANAQLDGFGGLVYPFPPIAGSPFAMYVGNNLSLDKQWSDELQYNYDSHLLTMTLGALYYWQSGYAGGPPGMSGDFAFTAFPGGQIPLGDLSESYNKQTSVAAYGQVEFHIMDKLDLVGGLRETRDKKSGSYVTGGTYVPGANGAFGGIIGSTAYPFEYQKTKPSYSLGPNYKPAQDVLVYAKYSTAFVSGGSVGGLAFQPEVADSWDLGVKSEFLEHRLRANLALFDVRYEHIQSAQGGVNVGVPQFSTVIVDLGNGRAKGAELELNALPMKGLTLGASAGYTNVTYDHVNPILTAEVNGPYLPTLIPRWTSNLSAEYVTEPLFGGAKLVFSTEGIWKGQMRVLDPGQLLIPAYASVEFIPAGWVVNARIALRDIKIGPLDSEVAIWGRNINNNKEPTYPLDFAGFVVSSLYQAAPTYGADFLVRF